jgi:hypothetical protein
LQALGRENVPVVECVTYADACAEGGCQEMHGYALKSTAGEWAQQAGLALLTGPDPILGGVGAET